MGATPGLDELRALREQIHALVVAHRGLSVAVFGSVARGEATEDSDIDFLVKFEPESSLFDLAHLTDALSDLLGRPVDVVSVGALKPRDERIRTEAIQL
jgi:predicted nucleotidyltransferase